MIQAIAAGQIGDVVEGRKYVANSVELKTYKPQEHQLWDEKYKQVKQLFEM